MNTKLSILFYAKMSKITFDGLIPIYIRVTVDGERIEFSTKRCTHHDKWSVEGSCMKGTSAESKATNTFLDTLKTKVYEYQQQLIREDNPVNAENMRNKILGLEKRSHNMLIQIFQRHNDDVEALIGKDFAAATLERYKTSLKHTVDFPQRKYKVSDIDIRKIDHEFVTGYEFYLKTECNCYQNTAVKYIKNFGRIIRICIANGWLYKNPYVNYKSKVKEVKRIFLAKDELETTFNKQFSTDRLNQVKDILLFSCFTGLAYADVKKLTADNIGMEVDWEKWIFINQTKTDTPSNKDDYYQKGNYDGDNKQIEQQGKQAFEYSEKYPHTRTTATNDQPHRAKPATARTIFKTEPMLIGRLLPRFLFFYRLYLL